MNISSSYRALFKLNIFHSYFLDDGEKSFNSMNEVESKFQLKSYDWKDFLEIKPSPVSMLKMDGLKIVFKTYQDSIILAIKVVPVIENQTFIELDENESLTFILTLKDQYFGNYTNLDTAGKLLYFSNKTPLLPEPFTFKAIDRINQNATIGAEYLFEGENMNQLLAEANIVNSSTPLGIIRIFMKGDSPSLSLINNDGTLKNSLPHFKIHFENRKTYWKYIHRRDDFETETKKDWPLTKYGFIALEKKTFFKSPPAQFDKYVFPNPDARQIKEISNKIYSEIFI